MTTLYCASKSGKTKQWTVHTEGPEIVVTSGYVGGKLQEHRVMAEGKNIGKANETTSEQQALLEAQSKWNKKKDEGYKESLGEVTLVKEDADGFVKPMLATDNTKYIKYPCYIQPKLDGIRCLAFNHTELSLRSRSGKEITKSTIRESLEEAKHLLGWTVLDGEIYAHGHPFQDVLKAIKGELDLPLYYWVYDVVMPGTFAERLDFLSKLTLKCFNLGYSPFIFVQTRLIHNEQELLEAHRLNVEQGYEGSIIRNVDGKYEASFRSHDLIKYKDWYDAEFLIVGVKEGKGKFKGCAIYTCQVRSNLFDCTSPGTLEEKKEAWNNRESAIDKPLTVKYQEFTNEGIPRFPTAIAIRDYE
jgi:DNA ligase-1